MTPANFRLSAERARVVRDGLTARGVSPDRLVIDTAARYHTLMDEVVRLGSTRTPSIGVCLLSPTR